MRLVARSGRVVGVLASCSCAVLLGCGRVGIEVLELNAEDPTLDASASDGPSAGAGGTVDAGGSGGADGGAGIGDAATGVPGASPDASTDGGRDRDGAPLPLDAAMRPDAAVADAAVSPDAGAPPDAGHDAGVLDGGLPVDAGAPGGVIGTLSAGRSHTCAIRDGGLYCWGANDAMVLGSAAGAMFPSPLAIPSPSGADAFVQVESGRHFACGRDASGGVWCWGDNARGMLATSDTTPSPVPLQVGLPAPAAQISAQYEVVCALLDDGSLWCWGDNTEGQAAQNDTAPYSDALSPLQVPGTDWAHVGAGQGHVCGIRTSGELWCWGRNATGQLGQDATAPIQIRTPVRVGTDVDWALVKPGLSHTCATRNDRSLWCWGESNSQQLGLDTLATHLSPTRVGTGNDWMTVEVSALHGCGLREPGTLWCWGRRDEGQLGLSYDPQPVPVPTRIGSRGDWVELSVGWMHSCARASDGTLWCSGLNDGGQLGDGSYNRPYAFVQVAAFP